MERVTGRAPAPLPFRIRVLRVVNPAIVWILRSPLHRLLSAGVLVLQFSGRRTGRMYRTPLSYVEIDGAPLCFTRPNET
jgi:hypothetical protein